MPGKLTCGFLLILILVGCSHPATEKKLTIATLKGPSSMGMIRLVDSLRNESSPSVQVLILNEPMQVRKMMIEGTADFAILPSTLAAVMYNKGLDYRLLAIPVWGSLYLAGTDTTVTGFSDLKGKRIFLMARGMTPDVLFRHLLLKNGIDPDKDINLDYSFPTHIDLANAVKAGQAALAVISEPQLSLAMKLNPEVKRIFSLHEEWTRFEGIPIAETAFMAGNSVIRNNRAVVEQLLKSYDLSNRWVVQHPDSAADLIVRYQILPETESALLAIPQINFKFVRADTIRKQVSDYFKVFFELNPDIVGGRIPDENFYYR